MSGSGEKVPRKYEQAIAALLTAPTITDAATQAGVSVATLVRWLKEPAFQTAYREARRQVVQQATTQLQQACCTAVTTLVGVMTDPEASPSARVSAAKTVLEQAMRGLEIEDLEARIVTLEQAIQTPERS